MLSGNFKNSLGINGLGRIGKLTLWKFIKLEIFDSFVINVGREVGKSLQDLIDYTMHDSTYGSIEKFLFGIDAKIDCEIEDEKNKIVRLFNKRIRFCTESRNPKDINWSSHGVKIVVDSTGAFLDPSLPADHPGGSLRGHLDSGAQKVILSAPFKFKNKTNQFPDDATMLVFGINHSSFDPLKHHIISAASCTTTGLAHMMKPLLDINETSNIITASMSTIHAATNSQSILDSVPKKGASDLRKSRSILDNIIISSTGAAKALEYVIPAVKNIGFMADSVRIPTTTVSLINLNVTFNTVLDDHGNPVINREFINKIYSDASRNSLEGLLSFSEKQNVSCDFKGGSSSIVIEGFSTHTRTGFVDIPPLQNVPVTHAKIFGWYDNEYGSYVNSLAKLTEYLENNI